MAKKSSSRRRKTAPWYTLTRTWLVLLCLVGGVMFGLIWLAGQQPPSPVLPVPPQTSQAPSDLTAVIRAETERFLESTDFRNSLVRRDLSGRPLRYTVDGNPPSEALLRHLQARLEKHSNRLSARLTDNDVMIITEAGKERLLVFFVPPLDKVPQGPRVAIIMDDLGRGTYPAEVLIGIQQPVTFSILPGESDALKVAQMAHAADREVLLHVPMEPQGYPAVNPGEEALFTRYSDQELTRRFVALLAKVPYAVGTNNHMGSRFTEDHRGMAAIMSVLRERGLFFVDSLTTGHSVGASTALENGVPVLKRDVFLDNVADVELIVVELHRLAEKARLNGQAIGICHPYPETLQALQRELPRLAEQGIRIVPVSKLFAVRPRG
jgi:uncharacterized protein